MGFLLGDMSKPLIEPDLLVGGEVSAPWDEMGERMGDGERLTPADEREVRPGMCTDSRLLAAIPWDCSAWTTSAKEIKLRRRTSAESRDP